MAMKRSTDKRNVYSTRTHLIVLFEGKRYAVGRDVTEYQPGDAVRCERVASDGGRSRVRLSANRRPGEVWRSTKNA